MSLRENQGKKNSSEILTDEQIIESLRKNEDDYSRVLESVSREEAIKVAMKHNFLLQFGRSTPQLHKTLQKVRNEIQLDLNFHINGSGSWYMLAWTRSGYTSDFERLPSFYRSRILVEMI